MKLRRLIDNDLTPPVLFAAVVCCVVLFVILTTYGQEPQRLAPQYAEWPPTSGTYWLLMDRVTDGDTIRAFILVPVRGRLHGIQAEELRDKDPDKKAKAVKAKEALAEKMKYGWRFRAQFHGKDDFGRMLLIPYDDNGKSLCDFMVSNGHAIEWNK